MVEVASLDMDGAALHDEFVDADWPSKPPITALSTTAAAPTKAHKSIYHRTRHRLDDAF